MKVKITNIHFQIMEMDEVQMLPFCGCCCFDGFHGFQRSGLSEDGPVRAADLRAAVAAPVLRQPEGKEREQLSGAGPQQEDALPSETPSSRGKITCWLTHDIQQYYLQKPHSFPPQLSQPFLTLFPLFPVSPPADQQQHLPRCGQQEVLQPAEVQLPPPQHLKPNVRNFLLRSGSPAQEDGPLVQSMHCSPTRSHAGPRVPSRSCRFPVDAQRQRVKRRSARRGRRSRHHVVPRLGCQT